MVTGNTIEKVRELGEDQEAGDDQRKGTEDHREGTGEDQTLLEVREGHMRYWKDHTRTIGKVPAFEKVRQSEREASRR